jgi:hypothetical protein
MGFNSTALGGSNGAYRFAGSLTGSINSIGIRYTPAIQSDATGAASILYLNPSTASNGGTPYTVTTLQYFVAAAGTFSADSTVTNQRGFEASSNLTGATNNFGFFSNLASATGRWNFYASGTALNYLAGDTGIGGVVPIVTLDVDGAQAANVTAVGALDINCSLGNYFTKTINGASTFTVSNVPASRAYAFTVEIVHTSGTITWFSGVQWPNNNTAPTLTTGKTHLITWVTDNGGTTWRGVPNVNYNS